MTHAAGISGEPAGEIQSVFMVKIQTCWKNFLSIIINIIDHWRPLKTDGQTSFGPAAGGQVVLPWCLRVTDIRCTALHSCKYSQESQQAVCREEAELTGGKSRRVLLST